MTLYRYYKGAERALRWRAIEIEREGPRLASEDVMFATVLALSEKPDRGEAVSENAKYWGPFFVDIDNDDSIASAIKTAKAVINKLLSLKVSEKSISLWASGKRGFHITVPMGVYTEDTPVLKLPLIYRQMAIAMKLFDLADVDATVYSTGRGRMWRLENKLRPDNNRYKVRLTVAELLDLTPERYEEFVSSPRSIEVEEVVERSSLLSALYNMSKGRADHMEKPKGIFIDPVLKAALGDELPPCAQNLLTYQNIKEGKGFNDTSLQFAKAVASFSPERSSELITEFSEKSHGISYNSPSKRKDHCNRAFKIAAKSAGYDWSCTSVLSVLRDEPCFDCPIAFIRVQEEDARNSSKKEEEEQPEVEVAKKATKPKQHAPDAPKLEPETEEVEEKPTFQEPPSEEVPKKAKKKYETSDVESGYNLEGLLAADEGYGFMDGSGKFRRVSNFTLKITKVFVEYIPMLEMDRRVAIQAEVYINKVFSGLVFLDESNWNSKAGFISAFSGLANAAYYGKDDDVQKMKSALMLGVEGSTEIRKVNSCGIHRQQIGSQWVFTYVEPGWSFDQFGNENLYTLAGKITAYPRLRGVSLPSQKDAKLSEILESLMAVNQPHRIAQVLGWTMAAFLKCHIFTFRNEFPLLSLHGEPGSGKTSTASVFAALHGVDYRLEFTPLNLPATTAFPVWTFISQSNTVPRLLEEFNKSKMPRNYDVYTENFKACWNEHAVSRGTLANVRLNGGSPSGAIIQEIKLSGPVVLCSEQEINTPSLVERTVQVRFSQKDKAVPEYICNFEYVCNNIDDLKPFAKACYMEAVVTPIPKIRAWLENAGGSVPAELSARPKYCYQVVLAGLSFMEHVCQVYQLDCILQLRHLKDEFIMWLNDNRTDISTSKKVSEIDIIMQKLATMAAISESDSNMTWLLKNKHYLREGDKLWIDPLVAHAQYMKYVGQVERGTPVIDGYKEFIALMRGEKYCVSVAERRDGFARDRAVVRLSVHELAKKGIPVEAFEEL